MNIYPVGQNKRADSTHQATGASSAQVCRSTRVSPKRWRLVLNRSNSDSHVAQATSCPSSTEQVAAMRQLALSKAQQGNYTEAIALFNQILRCNPDSANDYSNRGLVYFQSGQTTAAIADYNKAIELNPRLDSAYNNRANYYASRGQFLEAILDYDIALDLNPTNIRAWINQGITFRELEMYDRALESFDLALCLGRLEGHIYAERGRTYHLRGDWNCAIGDYQRALATLPEAVMPMSPSVRLRFQVEAWLADLLGELQF